MEQRKDKKKQLKWRIILRISIVLTVSMLISTLVGYGYFDRVVKKQKIADEQAKQQQVANQIIFMTEDIQNFTKNVIADESLQELLKHGEFQNEFEKTKNSDMITKRLEFYNSLRTYIASSFMELEKGERYTSSINSQEENYIERKFGVEEFKQYQENPKLIYSNPYIGLESRATSPVICCRTKMWSQEQFGVQKGTLYVEIYLDYFIRQVEAYGTDYENVCLLGNGQELLYQQDKGEKIAHYISKNTVSETSGVYKTKEGYLICRKIEETGWKLCTLITRDYLWSQSNFVLKFFLLSFLLSLSLILISTSRILEGMIQPITRLSKRMGKIQYDKMEVGEIVPTGDEIQTLYECYEAMLQEIHRGIEERIASEKQKKEMEFDIMLSQTNPHYLYNVLNTIVYLAAAEKNKNIVKITNSLIYTLQATLNLGEHSVETTVAKELELTSCYAAIQEYRYPEMFVVHVECAEELKEYRIPKTSIQPLVENALLHGILPTDRPGEITIVIRQEAETLVITVRDNGKGIEEDRLKKFLQKEEIVYEKGGRKHIGISNIRDRIEYLYGAPYGMEIKKRELGGTEVVLVLPILKE